MSTNEKTKNFDFGSCCAMMAGMFKGSAQGGTAKEFNMENCREMMKQCCGSGEGKFDFQSMRAMMAKCFEQTGKGSGKKEDATNAPANPY